jgi:hypothetical protein
MFSIFFSFLPFSPFYSYKSRRLADEDDELSEVQPDAVPPEVREWLASTFTRQLATTRKKSDEKPKFRSVAHAIRAGIFVDRIYRRVSSTALMQFPPEVVKVLKVNIYIIIKKIVVCKVQEENVCKRNTEHFRPRGIVGWI